MLRSETILIDGEDTSIKIQTTPTGMLIYVYPPRQSHHVVLLGCELWAQDVMMESLSHANVQVVNGSPIMLIVRSKNRGNLQLLAASLGCRLQITAQHEHDRTAVIA